MKKTYGIKPKISCSKRNDTLKARSYHVFKSIREEKLLSEIDKRHTFNGEISMSKTGETIFTFR